MRRDLRKGETIGMGRERRRSVGKEVDREVGMKWVGQSVGMVMVGVGDTRAPVS